MHNAGMVAVTIRDVPGHVRAELATRAARSGQWLQEYLHGLLVQVAGKPTLDDAVARARVRVATTGARLDPEVTLAARDADRR